MWFERIWWCSYVLVPVILWNYSDGFVIWTIQLALRFAKTIRANAFEQLLNQSPVNMFSNLQAARVRIKLKACCSVWSCSLWKMDNAYCFFSVWSMYFISCPVCNTNKGEKRSTTSQTLEHTLVSHWPLAIRCLWILLTFGFDMLKQEINPACENHSVPFRFKLTQHVIECSFIN